MIQSVPLNAREKQALESLIAYRMRRIMSPSVKELAAEMGVCQSRAHQLMKSLIDKGYVTRQPFSARSWVPIDRFGAPIGWGPSKGPHL
jgi:DNA-binding MarR family transcriptional regulator